MSRYESVDITVIIPTRERPAKIAECVRHLRAQTIETHDGLTGRFEVLVGIDGPDDGSDAAARSAWGSGTPSAGLRVVECPRAGLAATRNRLIELSRGRWIVSINDDLYARAGFLDAHAHAHVSALQAGRPAVIVGSSPWRVFPDDTLFDRLVRETSMIFFYDRMDGAWERRGGSRPEEGDPSFDWGFRHCFGLNHSVSAGALKEIGGYAVFPAKYGYEDTEAAWRLRERFGMPVLYRPRASGEHDHRYLPADYLAREEMLGYAAWGFAEQSPRCAAETFGRDIRSAAEIAYSREYVEREAKTAERLRASLERTARMPGTCIAGANAPDVLNLLYEQHLLLKRWLWRRGLVRASMDARRERHAA